jgi:NAD(P)-dependent dehydrogenase (short-subunit alcohol dehydrogenase family)
MNQPSGTTMADRFDLTGKTALVTGGAGLIGEALCEALADHGATVVVGDVAVDPGRDLADRLGADVEFRELDITSEASVEETIDAIRADHRQLDVLVNSAYPRNEHYGRPYEEVAFEDWQENLDLHLNGYFCTSYHASLAMLDDEVAGSIINLGSTYGVRAPEFSVYDGTDMTSPVEYAGIKGGIVNLTRYLASYLGEDGIRANTLSPGGVFADQHPSFVEAYERRTMLGRMAEPEDLKGPVVFLASDASRYVTGHNLLVDGGWTSC